MMQNRRVVLITNVKPGKLRDVMSAGLVGIRLFYCLYFEQLCIVMLFLFSFGFVYCVWFSFFLSFF